MIVAVKARLESGGALVATLVKVEDRRSLSGVITQLNGNLVFVQGLQHTLTTGSLIYDALNQLTGAPALKVNQQVQLVAKNENAQTEVLTLRIVSGGVTGVRDRTPIAPAAFELAQNHPNPFNPATVIRYSLPQAGFARLSIYDLLGRRVRTLLDGVQPAGAQQVTWDSRDDSGRLVASGIYFYRLESEGLVQTRRLMLTR
jgi:flagellar hook assembly protein FlgD